jgi:hypothetical protein
MDAFELTSQRLRYRLRFRQSLTLSARDHDCSRYCLSIPRPT